MLVGYDYQEEIGTRYAFWPGAPDLRLNTHREEVKEKSASQKALWAMLKKTGTPLGGKDISRAINRGCCTLTPVAACRTILRSVASIHSKSGRKF